MNTEHNPTAEEEIDELNLKLLEMRNKNEELDQANEALTKQIKHLEARVEVYQDCEDDDQVEFDTLREQVRVLQSLLSQAIRELEGIKEFNKIEELKKEREKERKTPEKKEE